MDWKNILDKGLAVVGPIAAAAANAEAPGAGVAVNMAVGGLQEVVKEYVPGEDSPGAAPAPKTAATATPVAPSADEQRAVAYHVKKGWPEDQARMMAAQGPAQPTRTVVATATSEDPAALMARYVEGRNRRG
jgi:hypothetical protein